MKILVIEDDSSLSEIIERTFKNENYIVETAQSFSSAYSKLANFEYDCILLDIMLPDGGGLDLLKYLKEQRKAGGVIIISAKDSIDDKITGLNLGADDYLAKPFHLSELVARVNSIIRRNNNGGNNTISVGNVSILVDKSLVYVGEEILELSKKEYDIFLYFTTRRGYVVSKETLAEAVWGDHIDQADNFDFIYTHLKNLRKKLAHAQTGLEIKSVYGFGYKMIEQ